MVTRLVTILLQNTPFLPFLLYSLLCLIVWNYIDRRALKSIAIRFILNALCKRTPFTKYTNKKASQHN